jgi:hypothetical protein
MRWDARRQVSAGQAFAVWVDIASGLASSTLPETMCVGAARMVQHIILQAIYLGTAVSSLDIHSVASQGHQAIARRGEFSQVAWQARHQAWSVHVRRIVRTGMSMGAGH